MDITPYVETLRAELAVAAEAGGDEARALADRLSAPLASATRLAILDALSAAAEEITAELAPGSVDVRLRGRDPQFVVTKPPSADDREGAYADEWNETILGLVNTWAKPSKAPSTEAEEGGTSRITLRLPEHLKNRAEEAAGAEGLSVNAWLVRAVAAALEPEERGRPSGRAPGPRTGKHYTGWVR